MSLSERLIAILPTAKTGDIVPLYAELQRDAMGERRISTQVVAEINQAIIDRWSLRTLTSIKTKALIANEKEESR
jgi:hypothetical protein